MAGEMIPSCLAGTGRRCGPAFSTAAVLACMVTGSLSAQVVRGRLVDQAVGAGIGLAFIVLLDDRGVEVVRTISREDGGFSMGAPGPGSYQLRSERIGFKSALTEPFTLRQDQIREVRIAVVPVVVRLDTLTVEDDSKECRVYGAQGLATAAVWEEARKLLAAVAWTESEMLFRYDTRSYERRMNDAMQVTQEAESQQTDLPRPPYRSVPADYFREHGYAYVSRDSVTFYAPDAKTFFSDLFLNQHCFNLTRDDDREDLIGLEFEPVSGGGSSDVRGVFWLDEAASEVRWLDLRYTGVSPPVYEQRSQGRVEFQQIFGGPWFVSRWWIRVPSTRVPSRIDRGLHGWIAEGYYEVGGEVLRVLDLDGRPVFETVPRQGREGGVP